LVILSKSHDNNIFNRFVLCTFYRVLHQVESFFVKLRSAKIIPGF